MKFFVALCVLAVVSSAFAAPETVDYNLIMRDAEILTDTKKLIEELVGNLRKSAEEAVNAVGTFTVGLKDEAKVVRDKIVADINKFRLRVTEAVENVAHRISDSSAAVKECVDSHRSAAAAVFNDTLSGTMACVDNNIKGISDDIQHLSNMASDAMSGATKALEDMKGCTADHTNLLATGTCLGKVAIRTEVKSVGFLAQSGVTIGRINIAIATLPASLEVCAGSRLVHTGIETGKIVVQIGTCSVGGVFNTITGRPHAESNVV